LTTLTCRPAAARAVAGTSEYGPVVSMQKWTGAPAACRSAQASRAACPFGSLAKVCSFARPGGRSRQASRVSVVAL
jgi:hypothetical protein